MVGRANLHPKAARPRSGSTNPTRLAHPVKVAPSGRSPDRAPRPPGGRVATRAELVAPPRGPDRSHATHAIHAPAGADRAPGL